MKVYVVNVNNCESYEDYKEWNAGVFASKEDATQSMTDHGYDQENTKHWDEDSFEEMTAYRIEEFDVIGIKELGDD